MIQEAVDSSANILKLTLPHKVELHITVWSKGTPEQFLVHIEQALDAINQKGLLTAYEKAVKDKEVCIKKIAKATEALEKYMGEDANPPKEKVVQNATEAGTHADEAVESTTNQVFQLYSNLLVNDARRPWNKVLEEQIDCSPWIDLFGVKHAEQHKRSWSSLMDCMTFHLQTVFRSDAVETQQFYISNSLEKPNRVPIRLLVQRTQLVNGFLDLLPCPFYSNCMTKLSL